MTDVLRMVKISAPQQDSQQHTCHCMVMPTTPPKLTESPDGMFSVGYVTPSFQETAWSAGGTWEDWICQIMHLSWQVQRPGNRLQAFQIRSHTGEEVP